MAIRGTDRVTNGLARFRVVFTTGPRRQTAATASFRSTGEDSGAPA